MQACNWLTGVGVSVNYPYSGLAVCGWRSAKPRTCRWHLHRRWAVQTRKANVNSRSLKIDMPEAGLVASRIRTGQPFLARCRATEDPIRPAPITNTEGFPLCIFPGALCVAALKVPPSIFQPVLASSDHSLFRCSSRIAWKSNATQMSLAAAINHHSTCTARCQH